jgi:hypothetical protein
MAPSYRILSKVAGKCKGMHITSHPEWVDAAQQRSQQKRKGFGTGDKNKLNKCGEDIRSYFGSAHGTDSPRKQVITPQGDGWLTMGRYKHEIGSCINRRGLLMLKY